MTPDPSNPTAALPDELLLDLVEGTLRSQDVERVRAALKADPRLAKRLEAMRADRREVVALGDPGVSSAPAGLVADAIHTVERDTLLVDHAHARPGIVRRLAPALVAACVGLVAVAGWYAHTEGLLFAPDEPAQPLGVKPGDLADAEQIEGTGQNGVPYASRQKAREHSESIKATMDLAKDIPGFLPGDTGTIGADQATVSPLELDPAVGGPIGADLLANDDADAPPSTPVDAWPSTTNVASKPTPEPGVPDEAAQWAREGVLRVVVAPVAERPFEDFERYAARSLYIAYDPTVSRGWGITSLPSLNPTSVANATGAGGTNALEVDPPAADRPITATLRLDADASDDELRAAIVEMAQSISALSGLRVRLERVPDATEQPGDAGRPAMTIDTLLWWRQPAELWKRERVYHLPVRADG